MKRWIRSVQDIIYAQAVERKELGFDLRRISGPLLEHLIKYYCAADDNQNLQHWATEIHAFLPKVTRLKGSNKFPKQAFLYENVYEPFGDQVLDWYRGICKQENLEYPEDTNQLETFIKTYCRWLCYELSSTGHANLTAVRTQLDSYKHDAQNYFI